MDGNKCETCGGKGRSPFEVKVYCRYCLAQSSEWPSQITYRGESGDSQVPEGTVCPNPLLCVKCLVKECHVYVPLGSCGYCRAEHEDETVCGPDNDECDWVVSDECRYDELHPQYIFRYPKEDEDGTQYHLDESQIHYKGCDDPDNWKALDCAGCGAPDFTRTFHVPEGWKEFFSRRCPVDECNGRRDEPCTGNNPQICEDCFKKKKPLEALEVCNCPTCGSHVVDDRYDACSNDDWHDTHCPQCCACEYDGEVCNLAPFHTAESSEESSQESSSEPPDSENSRRLAEVTPVRPWEDDAPFTAFDAVLGVLVILFMMVAWRFFCLFHEAQVRRYRCHESKCVQRRSDTMMKIGVKSDPIHLS